jgi:hypothetical protein
MAHGDLDDDFGCHFGHDHDCFGRLSLIPRPQLILWTLIFGMMVPMVGRCAEKSSDSKPTWSTSALLSLYCPTDESAFLLPVVTADRGSWHLEGRYNYEDRQTGSLWTGWTFSGGKSLGYEVTPIVGVVTGNTRGVAPGLEMSLAWKKWNFYTEAEYLFDSEDSDSNYFYNWSELSYDVTNAIRIGVVGQRTRVVNMDKEFERGPLVGYEYKNFNFTAYLFNIGEDTMYPVFSIGMEF